METELTIILILNLLDVKPRDHCSRNKTVQYQYVSATITDEHMSVMCIIDKIERESKSL